MKTNTTRKTHELGTLVSSLFLLLAFTFFFSTIYAQSPQKMTYQSVVRDASGNLLTNTTVGIQINILQGSASGASVYTETFNPTPQTNINGLVSLEIGSGIPSTGVFTNIDWANGPYFLKVGIDPTGGTNYTITSTSQLLSVPYALYAETSGNAIANGSWSLSGNAGTNSTTDFIGTIDDQALKFRIENEPFGELNRSIKNVFFGERTGLNSTGINNIGMGYQALTSNTTGFNNIGIGNRVLEANTIGHDNIGIGETALRDNTTGHDNIGMGFQTLSNNTTGEQNIGMGDQVLTQNTIGTNNIGMGDIVLRFNTTGFDNIGIGNQVLTVNTMGHDNVGMGYRTIESNTTGNYNIGIGNEVLRDNTIGGFNIGMGVSTLRNNITGDDNIGIGNLALTTNTSGSFNTAIGNQALERNTTGDDNVGIGHLALTANTTGNKNTAIGYNAMSNVTSGQFNTAIGDDAMASVTTSLNNTAIGKEAMPNATGSNNTAIGHEAEVANPAASHQVRIGNSQITSATIQVPWTSPSDKKWKEQIRPLPHGLEVVSQLKPVDYVRKNNEAKTREIGFIAQDVEKLLVSIGYLDQGLLSKDSKGGLSLRYNDFIALLTKAIQELNTKNNELLKRIEMLEQRK